MDSSKLSYNSARGKKTKQLYRFYYGDERKADGSAKYRVDGDAHAELYWKLAEEDKTQGPWLQTFVKGIGYKKFEDQYASSS